MYEVRRREQQTFKKAFFAIKIPMSMSAMHRLKFKKKKLAKLLSKLANKFLCQRSAHRSVQTKLCFIK
jgi:hypothetical protein